MARARARRRRAGCAAPRSDSRTATATRASRHRDAARQQRLDAARARHAVALVAGVHERRRDRRDLSRRRASSSASGLARVRALSHVQPRPGRRAAPRSRTRRRPRAAARRSARATWWPRRTLVTGDLRALTLEQRERARTMMRTHRGRRLAAHRGAASSSTTATLPLAPTDGNRRLLALVSTRRAATWAWARSRPWTRARRRSRRLVPRGQRCPW